MRLIDRQLDEAIQIGDSITIVVTTLADGKLRIGIKAPPDMAIVRGELLGSPPTIPLTPGAPGFRRRLKKGGTNGLRNSVAARRRRSA